MDTNKPQVGYTKAQYVRPFIPNIFPDYDSYLWIDSDAWVQDPRCIDNWLDTVRRFPEKLCVSPTVDVGYQKFYQNYQGYLEDYQRVYRICYDQVVADEMRGRAVFSSGVFAMSGQTTLWQAWRDQLPIVYSKDYTANPDALHIAEQLALNVVAYRTGLYVPVDASHNFHCHAGSQVVRDPASGKAVLGDQPQRNLGIIHLSDFPHEKQRYINEGLLWDGGRYLSHSELEGLNAYQRK